MYPFVVLAPRGPLLISGLLDWDYLEVSRISNSEVYIRLASRLYWYLPRGLGRYLQSGWISDALEKALDGAGASWRGPWVFRLRV